MNNYKKTINSSKSILTMPKSNDIIFKKHNFAVRCADGYFRPFSYEASYSTDNKVDVRIKNAVNGDLLFNLFPTIDRISKLSIQKQHGTMNFDVVSVEYEVFCEALFTYICKYISDSDDLIEEDESLNV